MAAERKANVAGWMILLFGLVVTTTGVLVLWALWDAPPESVSQRLLLAPFVFGVPFLGFGLYSVIKNSPPENDGTVRYPYLFARLRERSRASGAQDERPSATAGNIGVGIVLGISLILVLGGLVFGVVSQS